jgi:hypothetical protein
MTDNNSRPSTATCPRCRPGRVRSYSWRVLDGQFWASVLWCDTEGCRGPSVTCAAAQPTREGAEADCFRQWADRDALLFPEQQAGGAA